MSSFSGLRRSGTSSGSRSFAARRQRPKARTRSPAPYSSIHAILKWNRKSRVRAILGTYDTMQYSAAFTSPIISDQVAVRMSGDYRYSRPSADIRDEVPGSRR